MSYAVLAVPAAVVLTVGALQAAEFTNIDLVLDGKRQELSDQARLHILQELPELFATCAINSRDDPRIFASWSFATIWEDTETKDHLAVRFASPIEMRVRHSAVISAQEFMMGLHDPEFPGPELSRHGERVVAYVKCSGIDAIKFVCAPGVKTVMPASYDRLCRYITDSSMLR